MFFCFDGDLYSLVGFYARSLVLCSLVEIYARSWGFMLAREVLCSLVGFMLALGDLYSPSGFYVRSRISARPLSPNPSDLDPPSIIYCRKFPAHYLQSKGCLYF